MKKIFSKEIFLLPLFLLLTLFVSVNKVNALSNLEITDFYSVYPYLNQIDSTIPSTLVNYYNNNLAQDYANYIIFYVSSSNQLMLTATNSTSLYLYENDGRFHLNNANNLSHTTIYYDFNSSSYDYRGVHYTAVSYLPYSSSIPFTLAGTDTCSAQLNNKCYNSLTLPTYSNLSTGISLPQYTIEKNYTLPTYTTLINGSYTPGPIGITGSSGLSISDLFTNPIQALQSVWSSIVNINNIIVEFLSLIPSPLKEFLISSFMLAIVLGVLKIVIG